MFKKNSVNKLRDKFPKYGIGNDVYLSDCGLDLLNRLLTYDPKKRITAR